MALKDRSGIEPTLFIGLGGAGGRILGLLRRAFNSEFGEISGEESPVQFLLLDTDDFQKLDPSVRDPLNEQEDFLSISHFNPRQYIDQHRVDHRSDLHRWFDWDTRPLLEDAFVRDGASRLRILGRLCFHRAYFEIEKVLSNKIARAKSARAYTEGGVRLRATERPFRVVIVGSSCGGTGSAIFLDLVHLVNRLVRESGATPDVLGFVFLPFWFIEANRQVDTDLVPYYQANAWAFFEELNHVLLQPARLAEIALDPRRSNGVDPDPVVADYEPLKTVYLLDAEIPNIGRFHDPGDWNDYIAQSIFQVFLAPEEGNLESVYSNIKTKLAEVDHRSGLRKRFAAIGYADLRHPGERLREFLALRAADTYAGSRLLRRADASAVDAAAEQLSAAIRDAIRGPIDRLDAATLQPLVLARFTVKHGSKPLVSTSAVAAIRKHVESAVDAFNAGLPGARELSEVVTRVRQLVENRLSNLELGFDGELEVLQQVFQAMPPASSAPPTPGELFTLDGAPLRGEVEITSAAASSRKFPIGSDRATQTSSYAPHFNSLNADLQSRANQYKAARQQAIETELRQRIIGVLQGSLWHDPRAGSTASGAMVESVLGQARARLDRARADLQNVTSGDGKLGSLAGHESLTARFYPPVRNADETWSAFRADYHRVIGTAQLPLHQAVRRLTADLLAPDAGASDSLERVRRALGTLAGFFINELDVSTDVITALSTAQREAEHHLAKGDECAKKELDRLTALQHNLYALSTPCCRIDRNRLAPGDSMPTVYIAAAKRKEEEIRKLLRLPSTPGVIDNDGSHLSLLQAVYAFSSQAVAGMDALRHAYESRDRSRSFPHLLREWNRTGLRVSRQSELDEAELLQFARARALSIHFGEGGDAGSNGAGTRLPDHNGAGSHGRRIWIPGLHVFQGPHGTDEAFWLLRYERNPRDGRFYLQARDVERIDGRHRTWRLSDEVEQLQPLNLDPNVRTYMASPLRWSHRALLEELEEIERGHEGDAFREAYREYTVHVRDLAAKHAAAGNGEAELLHRRMAQALEDYLAQLESRDVLVP